MDDKLKEIRWEINESTTIPGRVGKNVFQNKYYDSYPSKDLMIPLLSISSFRIKGNIVLNPYRKFGEILREKSLEKVLEKVQADGEHCVIYMNICEKDVLISCLRQHNGYGCQNCLYYKENLRDILNLGAEEMFKRIHRRLECLESFRMKRKEGMFLK